MIYLDVLFLLNWMIDYLILALVKKDFFPGMKERRIAAGAFLAAGSYLFWLCQAGIVSGTVRMLEGFFLISLVLLWTFSIRSLPLFLKTAAAVFGYTFLLGGFCHVLLHILTERGKAPPVQWWVPVGCMAAAAFIRSAGKRMQRETEKIKECTYEVEIRRKGRTVSLQGWYDSGNLLVSQWTGRGICVLPLEKAEGLLDEEEKKILSFLVTQKDFPWKIMTENLWSGIHRITYSSVGRKDGWMPGIAADHIIVKKYGEVLADTEGLMGITAQEIFQDGRFAVLLPADIFTKQTPGADAGRES